MEVRELIMLGSGAFWSLTYLLIIKRSFQDKTFGMPLAALCANISWEFIFSFIFTHPAPQVYVNIVWFFLDVVILFQLLKFWPAEFSKLSPQLFYPGFLLALGTSFFAILLITLEFNDWIGAYAAFGQNLMMSVLFISMLYNRNTVRGQSIYIALFKMLGTALASLVFYLFVSDYEGSVLLPFFYVTILVFDTIYVIMIYQKCRTQAIDPWQRF
jgi:hypothetical protein